MNTQHSSHDPHLKSHTKFRTTIMIPVFLIGLTLGKSHAVQKIACGETISNTITNAAQNDYYEFSGNDGDIVLLTVNGVWEPYAGVYYYAVGDIYYEPTGTQIGTSESTPIRLGLTNSGTYLVAVHADNNAATGSYGINFALANGKCGPPVLWGLTTPGSITKFGQTDSYTVAAESNSLVTVTVSGRWEPYAGVYHYAVADMYDPAGNLLASATNAATPLLTLTNPGTYAVLIHAEDYNAGGNRSLYGGSSSYTATMSYIRFPGPPWLDIGTTNGAAALSLYGILDNSTTVQYATNLVNGTNTWLFLTNFNLPYVPYRFVDWFSTNVTQRYYRIFQ